MGLSAAFSKHFPGGIHIQAQLELALDAADLTVLFGPSGCGKTTVLRCLAGLEQPDHGSITADGQVWYQTSQGPRVPAAQRGIGFVFQESALFTHLGVAGNVGYGLFGWPRLARARRVAELVELMGLGSLLHRRPAELSGGERQRVALARALAPNPRLLLLDEPFAALDQPAAAQLRHSLRQVLRTLNVPAVLVTHDPMEALTLGDRMLRMAEGRIVQEGTPAEVLSRPVPGEEPIGTLVRTQVLDRIAGLLRLTAGGAELYAPDPGGTFQEAYACIRAEGVSLELGPHKGALTQRNRLEATILAIEPLGALTRVQLHAGFTFQALITTWACQDLQLAPGQSVLTLIKASAIKLVPVT